MRRSICQSQLPWWAITVKAVKVLNSTPFDSSHFPSFECVPRNDEASAIFELSRPGGPPRPAQFMAVKRLKEEHPTNQGNDSASWVQGPGSHRGGIWSLP
mmetsp:Transcript_61138/g.162431  ORF Transcript_61138/g.162431 Transcript_61138/m.162431 type:complete len:100 (+) Transcript_61138:131-430(+)